MNYCGIAIQMMRSILLLVMITVHSFHISAQAAEASAIKNFSITIEQTREGIRLTSHEGSAWQELKFNLKKYNTQAIDEYGMTEIGRKFQKSDPNLADYLFTITRSKNGILLQGIKGTAWKKLNFSLGMNKKQTIHQNGMSDPN